MTILENLIEKAARYPTTVCTPLESCSPTPRESPPYSARPHVGSWSISYVMPRVQDTRQPHGKEPRSSYRATSPLRFSRGGRAPRSPTDVEGALGDGAEAGARGRARLGGRKLAETSCLRRATRVVSSAAGGGTTSRRKLAKASCLRRATRVDAAAAGRGAPSRDATIDLPRLCGGRSTGPTRASEEAAGAAARSAGAEPLRAAAWSAAAR